MLNKIFSALVFILFAFIGSNVINCEAAMPQKEMALGGLTIDSSYDEMVRIYGNPTSYTHGIEHMSTYEYGNSVTIGTRYKNRIWTIEVSDNNGWTTPRGLSVGMNISAALDMYGDADYVQSGSFKTAYCYFGNYKKYEGSYAPANGFIILFNKDSGKILQMGVYGGNSMVGFSEYYQGTMKSIVE